MARRTRLSDLHASLGSAYGEVVVKDAGCPGHGPVSWWRRVRSDPPRAFGRMSVDEGTGLTITFYEEVGRAHILLAPTQTKAMEQNTIVVMAHADAARLGKALLEWAEARMDVQVRAALELPQELKR